MSCSTTPCTENLTLDPFKRVCYSQGLVLGVDEFVQEELYFLEQHRWHNRGLHGYGTVCGLDVEIRDTAQGPEVFVAPGMALDPKGRRIRVGAAQCAQLNVWLARFGDTLGSPAPASPGAVELFLRLCYRECATDRVPIPSGPCRSADETTAASRVLDDFKLELATTPPDQVEADVVRQFGALLGSIEFSDAGPATLSLDDLEQLVRGLAPNLSPASPPLPSPPTGSPAGVWRIHPSDAEEYLRAAFRLWVTEVRPSLLPDGTNCAQGPPDGDCILLARLEFPVNEGATGLVVNGSAEAVTVDETARPYLLHTQLLQELFLGGAFIAEPGTNDHSQLVNLDQDDHQQYLLVAPPTDPAHPAQRTLLDHLLGGGNQIKDLALGTDPGDAMPVGQAAGGDLTLTYPNPNVARIQGHPVAPTQPTNLQVLQWIGNANGQWEPRTLDLPEVPPPQPTNFEPDLVRIFALSWAHHTVHDFFFTLDGAPVRGLALAFGVREFADVRIRIGTDRKRFDLGSFDDFSFEIFIEAAAANGLFSRLRIPAIDIVPIDPGPLIGAERRFTSGATRNDPAGSFLLGPAVFVRIPDSIEELMRRNDAQRVHVVLTGDHVMDADGKRAIDAEFLRSELSTGDRPVDSVVGLQGGLFRSWFRFGRQRDINRVTRAELLELGVTPTIADRLLDFRNNLGVIRDLRVLEDVPGVGPARLAQLRELLVIRD